MSKKNIDHMQFEFSRVGKLLSGEDTHFFSSQVVGKTISKKISDEIISLEFFALIAFFAKYLDDMFVVSSKFILNDKHKQKVHFGTQNSLYVELETTLAESNFIKSIPERDMDKNIEYLAIKLGIENLQTLQFYLYSRSQLKYAGHFYIIIPEYEIAFSPNEDTLGFTAHSYGYNPRIDIIVDFLKSMEDDFFSLEFFIT